MKHFNFMLTLLSLLISGSIFAQEKTPVKSVEVTASELTARAGASKDHRKLGSFKKEEILPVFSESGEWYETKCPEDLKVYIFQKYITVTGNNGVINGDNVNARAGASEDAQILFKFGAKTQVDVLGLEGGWVKIAPPPQATSWVNKQYTKEVAGGEVAVEEGGSKKTNKSKGADVINDTEVAKEDAPVVKKPGKKETATSQPKTNSSVEKVLEERKKEHEKINASVEEIQKNILTGEAEDKFLKTGWVKRMGRVVGRKATHSLQLSEGTDICHLLSSDESIKLEDYANKFVGIKGEDIGKEKRSDVPLISVTKIVILENGPAKIRLGTPSTAEKPAKEKEEVKEKETSEDK